MDNAHVELVFRTMSVGVQLEHEGRPGIRLPSADHMERCRLCSSNSVLLVRRLCYFAKDRKSRRWNCQSQEIDSKQLGATSKTGMKHQMMLLSEIASWLFVDTARSIFAYGFFNRSAKSNIKEAILLVMGTCPAGLSGILIVCKRDNPMYFARP